MMHGPPNIKFVKNYSPNDGITSHQSHSTTTPL